jgi:predicted RNA-binding protein
VDGSLIPALREGLGKNSTLETLEIPAVAHVTSFYIAVVEALQLNKSLKTLRVCYGTQNLTDDEVKHLTSVVKKNYVLESLTDLESSDARMGDLRSIFRLNAAGRRYLTDGHGSVVSRGVGVLSAVNDDLNCVFLHLLENPSLCNRTH